MGGGITRLRNNAFTLIELLAIIVILAIIAVITVPIILNIIENSKKGAITDSAYGYKDAVNKAYVQELSKPDQESLKLDGIYEVQNDGTLVPADGYSFGVTNYNTLPVSVSGDKPSSGTLTYENNVLKSGYLVIGDYRVTFNSDGTVTTVKNNGSSLSEQGNGGQSQNNQVVETLEIGDSVAYTTTLNGQTLDDWSVFYVDGDYTYLILDDYLPNADISYDIQSTHDLSTYKTYCIYYTNSREDLISAMTTKSNWDSLLTGYINGHAVNETRTANVWAMGAPTLDLWVNSWNATYPSDTLYTRYVDTEDIDDQNFNVTGYAIGDSANPTTTYIDLSGATGANNTLYFPSIDDEYLYGYWLASPSASTDTEVIRVYSFGQVNDYGDCPLEYYAFRPVIKLPSSVVNQ